VFSSHWYFHHLLQKAGPSVARRRAGYEPENLILYVRARALDPLPSAQRRQTPGTSYSPYQGVPMTTSRNWILLSMGALFLLNAELRAQSAAHPEAEISNGLLTARMYLPDPDKGYYRSTRFDWSGAVYSLKHRGNEYYGVWYDRIDPAVVNWVFEGEEIVSGPASALAGPVNWKACLPIVSRYGSLDRI
jgi:hypothetical protein